MFVQKRQWHSPLLTLFNIRKKIEITSSIWCCTLVILGFFILWIGSFYRIKMAITLCPKQCFFFWIFPSYIRDCETNGTQQKKGKIQWEKNIMIISGYEERGVRERRIYRDISYERNVMSWWLTLTGQARLTNNGTECRVRGENWEVQSECQRCCRIRGTSTRR